MESTFIYGYTGCHIDYKGYAFDSLLELRYAISIQDEYDFARECVKIYYDPLTNKSTNYIRAHTKSYKPDFLIRHKISRKSYLVEVKPNGFDDAEMLARYQNICSHYIAAYQYDWEYKVVLEQDIFLSVNQQALYDAVLSNKILYRRHFQCHSLDQRDFNGQLQRPSKEFMLCLKRNKAA